MSRILLLLALSFASAHKSSARPDILIILADDLGYATTAAYGGDAKRVATPNLDRLIGESARFTDAHVVCSVCSPSRAGLLSGRYPQRFGYYTNADARSGVPAGETLLARPFKDAGYATAAIGKWHLGSKAGQHPLDKGFDEFFGFDSSQTDYFKSPILSAQRERVKKHDYLTADFSARAADFIRRTKEKPFFLYLAYNAVHGPNQAPPEAIARFAALPQKEATQAGMLAALDDGIGVVLRALADAGREQDTLVFFLSDNGGLPSWWAGSNGPQRGFKRAQFDGGSKVPFAVRWPARIKGGQVFPQPVSSLDIAPTALAAAALPTTTPCDGVSLLPRLTTGEAPSGERTLYWAGSHFDERKTGKEGESDHASPPPSWAVRRGPWKLVQIFEMGAPMLFNTGEDIGEEHDLAAKHPIRVRKLTDEFARWFHEMKPPLGWKSEYFQQLQAVK